MEVLQVVARKATCARTLDECEDFLGRTGPASTVHSLEVGEELAAQAKRRQRPWQQIVRHAIEAGVNVVEVAPQ
jgi:hypothetical protein